MYQSNSHNLLVSREQSTNVSKKIQLHTKDFTLAMKLKILDKTILTAIIKFRCEIKLGEI